MIVITLILELNKILPIIYIAVPDLSKVMIIIIYTSDHSIVKIGRLLRRPFLLGWF